MKRILLLLVFIVFLGVSVLNAQDSNSKLIQTLLDKNILTKEEADGVLEDMPETKVDEKNVIEKTQNFVRKGFNTPYLNFGGYGMLLYQYTDAKSVHQDLRPRVVFLSMEGKIGEQFRYFAMAEFVSPSLFEFYGEWLPNKSFNFRAGQFKVPFTLENPISLTQLESIMNTRSVTSLAGMGSDIGVNNGGGRDIGLQLSGSLLEGNGYDYLQYWVGIFQGVGINKKENNNIKDLAGTLAFQPIKGLRIAGGIYAGQAQYALYTGAPVYNHVRNRWALSADYQKDRLYVRSEFIRGNDGGITKQGFYGMVQWYFVPKKFNGFVRLDNFYNNKKLKQKALDYTAGVSYYFAPACRLQLNYTYSDVSKEWASLPSSHNVDAQMQIVF